MFRRKRMVQLLAGLLLPLALIAGACSSDSDDKTDGDASNGEGGSSQPFELVTSSTPAMLTALDKAMSNNEPIVVTLWRPHWAYSKYDIRDLEDPENLMGGAEEIHAIGRMGFSDDFPEVAKAIKDFSLDDDQLASLENDIFGDDPENPDTDGGVDKWMAENADFVDAMLAEEGSGSISIAFIPWDEDIAVTYLWQKVLENKGYDVSVEQLDVAPVFQGIADGNVDLFFDTWLPVTHEDYWSQYGDDIEDLGIWYDNAKLTIAVPDYMDITSLDQLASIGDQIDHEIIGIEPGAGLTRVTKEEMMPGYGLD